MSRSPRRLGVYCDGPYRLVGSGHGARLAPDPADLPFLTFACAVGQGFDSTVFFARARRATAPPGTPLLPSGVGVVELPYYESLAQLGQLVRAIPGTVRAFWRGLAEVDAVWVFGPHPLAFLLVPLALARRKRVVLGVRQDTVAYFRSRLPSGRWKPALVPAKIWDRGFRGLARRLRTTVVGGELARQYGGDGPRLLTMTVTLVSDADVVQAPQDRDWSSEIQLLTVGRIDVEKNPLLLVEAIAALERERPGRYRLAWAGTGPLEESVRRRAEELGVSDRTELLGFVPFGPALLERYRSAHVFVHVSLTEGVPATLLEAFASGTPVVATDVGGVRLALEGGAAGLLVPPGSVEALVSAVLQVSDEPGLRAEIVRRGSSIVQSETLDVQASRVAEFIRRP